MLNQGNHRSIFAPASPPQEHSGVTGVRKKTEMIETRLLGDSPTIVHHRVSGRVSEAEALTGINEAIAAVERLIKTQRAFGLLLDMRGYIFDDLASHRTWSKGFKEHAFIKKHAKIVAVVGGSSSRFKAEKDLLETNTLRFFYEPDAAKDWLRAN